MLYSLTHFSAFRKALIRSYFSIWFGRYDLKGRAPGGTALHASSMHKSQDWKPPTAPKNARRAQPSSPSNQTSGHAQNADSWHFREVQRNGGGILAEWEFFSSSCLVFQYGVRDFRREAGTENMVVGFISDGSLRGSSLYKKYLSGILMKCLENLKWRF